MTPEEFNNLALLSISGILKPSRHGVLTDNGIFQRALPGWTPERNYDQLMPGVNVSSVVMRIDEKRRASATKVQWVEPHAVVFVSASRADGSAPVPIGGPVIYSLAISTVSAYLFSKPMLVPTLEALILDRLADCGIIEFAAANLGRPHIQAHATLRGFGNSIEKSAVSIEMPMDKIMAILPVNLSQQRD